jgi:mRNA interferase MazF
MSSPKRGEVWLVDLGYVAKVRPCLVISIPALERDRALVTLVPHTTNLRNSRFEVQVKAKFLREGAFDVQNLVTIPYVKLLRKLGELTLKQMENLEDVLLLWLGFESEEDEDQAMRSLFQVEG